MVIIFIVYNFIDFSILSFVNYELLVIYFIFIVFQNRYNYRYGGVLKFVVCDLMKVYFGRLFWFWQVERFEWGQYRMGIKWFMDEF